MARGLEQTFGDIDEDSLAGVMGEDARKKVFPLVREGLEAQAREGLERAGPLASDYFLMTNRIRRYTVGYCLVNRTHLPGRYPYVTTRLYEHCMRVPTALRVDHILYRRMYCELLPDLARIPWSKTGLPLDRFAPIPFSRWRLLLDAALRRLSRGRLTLRQRGAFDVDFRRNVALREAFLATLTAEAPGLDGVLPADLAARAVERHMAGRNLGGLLQSLYTVKRFLRRFLAPGMARLS
jgi:hypothetical protein